MKIKIKEEIINEASANPRSPLEYPRTVAAAATSMKDFLTKFHFCRCVRRPKASMEEA